MAHGASGGAVEEIRGGEFRHGFYASAIGSAAGSITGTKYFAGDSAKRIAARTSIAAVAGGTASELSGGKFANGALTASFQHLFNAEGEKIKGLLFADRSFAIEKIQVDGEEITKGEYLQRFINGTNRRLREAGSDYRVKLELVDDEESFRAIVKVYENGSYITGSFVSHGDMTGKIHLGVAIVDPGVVSAVLDRLLMDAPPSIVFCKPERLEDAVDAWRHIENEFKERGYFKKNE